MIAAAVTFTALPPTDEQDIRCLAFLSRVTGKIAGELRRRVDAGTIWDFGRMAVRSSAIEPLGEVAGILADPAYDRSANEADK